MDGLLKFLNKWGIPASWVLIPIAAFALFIVLWGYVNNQELFGVAFSWVFFLAPLWLPVLLVTVGWPLWVNYRRRDFIASQKNILLEVRIPRDIDKSPRAMEAVFDGLAFGGGEGTFIDRYWKGGVRPWSSFEIASIGGQIHFYIWTRKGIKEVIESNIYAQYPGVEIYEVEDYATRYRYNPKTHSVWGCDFKLTKADIYPIKSYLDYELEKDPKEEYKIDPIAHIFEAMSSLGPTEQMWVQFIFRQHKDKRPVTLDNGKKALFATEDRWKNEAAEEIQKIRDKATPKYTDKEGNEQKGIPNPSPAQIEAIKAIDRSLGKYPFDAGIRGAYIVKKDDFNVSRITMLTGLFRNFGSGNLNGLAPSGWFTTFSWPWQEWFMSKDDMAQGLLDAYKRRSWFWPPYQTPHYVLTSEELATVYHFPSRIVQAPGLARIPATKSEAPSNLPI